jgi:Undecaprenyl-phosphate glucose phosphotransferase
MEYGQAFFLYILAMKCLDALTVLGLWYLTWYVRFHSNLLPVTKNIPPYEKYAAVAFPLMVVFSAVFHIVGAYRRERVHFGFRAIKKLAQGSILATLVFVSILYFLDEVHYSRVYLAVFPAIAFAGLFLERGVLHILWQILEDNSIRRIRVLLVGTGELLKMYVEKVEARRPYPVAWLGRLGPPPLEDEVSPDLPYLGVEEQIGDFLRLNKVDVVVISYPTDEMTTYEMVLEILSNEMVDVKVLPDFGRYATFTYSADSECGIPLLHFNQPPLSATDRALKRVEDLVGCLVAMILLGPLFLLVALLVRLTSRGPIFYGQTRIGADGRFFTCYKFRSMEIDAEKGSGAVWAVPNDPRVTALGKWLRRSSLDELPQFWNVLKGEMSLVGPRPERPMFVDQFRKEIPKYMLRHRMKSGITGWAQVNGWRGNTSIEERIKHDLYYIGHWSHFFDIKILVLTFIKGFINRHAY